MSVKAHDSFAATSANIVTWRPDYSVFAIKRIIQSFMFYPFK